jgi:cell division protein YceG involved in septum cleavage
MLLSHKSHLLIDRKKKSFGKTLVILLAVIAVIGLITPQVISRLSGAPDFPGPGSGSVQVQIEPGETLAQIGNSLKDLA